MAKFFVFPFAEDGDKTAIPDDTQISGSVSYEQGFGLDYQKNLLTDPQAKPFPRAQFNQLMYDMTDAIRQYQTHGVPDFITSAENGGVPYPYDIWALVRYDAGSGVQLYQSLEDNNTALPSDTTKWRIIAGQQVPIGTMLDFAGNAAPAGYLNCDGSAVSRTTYADLFAVIGTLWGAGDGTTTFNLPDFRRRVAVGSGGTGTVTLGNAVGNTGGEEAHTMTLSELVPHHHSYQTLTNPGGIAIQGGTNYLFQAANTTDTGGGTPFNVMQPSAVVFKIIKY